MVNTVTAYRSPVRLVKHAFEDTEVYSSQAISRARKKLMAEIALSGDEIVIDDVAYSRNDASMLLDNITEPDWKVHSVIAAHKGLLDFLEKDEFNDEELKKADAYLYNATFVHSVSPYFAHSFNAVSGNLLKGDDFDALTKLLNYQGYIIPEYSEEAFQKLRTYLNDLSYTLRNLSWEKFIADESILHFVFSDEWKRFFNKLPSSFTTLRDEVVENLINIVLHFQHKATWEYLHQVLVQLKAVETNDFNRSEVERIDKVIYKNSLAESKGTLTTNKKTERWLGRGLWWGIWIILMIVRANSCNERNNYSFGASQTYTVSPPPAESPFTTTPASSIKSIDEKRNEGLLLRFLDSLSKEPGTYTEHDIDMQTGSQPLSSFAEDFIQSGTQSINLKNNTSHDCVLLCFDGPSHTGAVYEDALSNTRAVYIRHGESFSFNAVTGNNHCYLLFGDKWGKLHKQKELAIYSARGTATSGGRRHILFLYEFFSRHNGIQQSYLKKGFTVDDADAIRDNDLFTYLNTPDAAKTEMNIAVQEKDGRMMLTANGNLLLREDKK